MDNIGQAETARARGSHGAVRLPPTFSGPPSDLDDIIERRKHIREKVLKAAKIIHGGGDAIFNCIVLDESPEGVFVDMGAVVAMPMDVTIQFATGATFRATRRWSTGTKIGFQFCGPQIVSHETARRMVVVGQILNDHGLDAAMQTLRVAQYFDNLELRHTAEAAEAAQRRFQDVLAGKNLI